MIATKQQAALGAARAKCDVGGRGARATNAAAKHLFRNMRRTYSETGTLCQKWIDEITPQTNGICTQVAENQGLLTARRETVNNVSRKKWRWALWLNNLTMWSTFNAMNDHFLASPFIIGTRKWASLENGVLTFLILQAGYPNYQRGRISIQI